MQKKFTLTAAVALALAAFASLPLVMGQGAVFQKSSDATGLKAADEILTTVSRLRQLDIKRPVKSGTKTREQIKESVVRSMEENTTPQELEASRKTLVKLGLIAKDFRLHDYMINLLREQVAGFYEPKTQEFYLAAWIPVSEQKPVMAHELVHALQDQHFNLRRFERWPKGDSDAETAAHALIEGDATLIMLQYDLEERGLRINLAALGSITETMLSQENKEDPNFPVLAKAPAVLREGLQFPYIYGAGFAQAILKHRSWQGLNESYTQLPVSTEQIIHPAKFLARDNPVKIEILLQPSSLGADWQQADADVNGEFGYQTILAEFINRQTARKAAEGWGGDRYLLLENKQTGTLLLAQFTTWDTAADAQEFFTAYQERTGGRYKGSQPLQPADARALPAEAVQRSIFKTEEGFVSVEMRDKDVVVVEGAGTLDQLQKISAQLWQSKKSAR